jgi:hypothetical protein
MTCPHKGKYLGYAIKLECGRKCGVAGKVFKCTIHKRCIPAKMKDLAKWQERPESRVYKACCDCPDNPKQGEIT